MPTDTTASGQFVLRLDPGLHGALRRAAAAAGVSLNAHCVQKLASPGTAAAGPAAVCVARAAEILGPRLVGLAAFGSWARGSATPASDIDLLIVAEEGTAVTRDLYHEWDAQPIRWDGHRVEPHFVHLPAGGKIASGLWAEVAIDGVVLFERALQLSRHLVGVRRQIADGRLVRRTAAGQSYWVEAA